MIQTDSYGDETSYQITDSDSRIIASSSSQEQQDQPGLNANEVYMLPFALVLGCYTITIQDAAHDGMCCEYGDGYYRVYKGDTLIAEGGQFEIESSAVVCSDDFSLPPAPATASSSSSSAPSTSALELPTLTPSTLAPTASLRECFSDIEFEMTLHLHTDQYGEETSWILSDTDNNIFSQNQKRLDSNRLYTVHKCLPKGTCYVLTLQDIMGDGMCCWYGNGYYEVYVNDELTLSGGQYQHQLVETFCDDSGSENENENENRNNDDSPSAVVMPIPSTEPSISQTSLECLDNEEFELNIEIHTDQYGQETSWQLSNPTGMVLLSESDLDPLKLYTIQKCLPRGSCYEFRMEDVAGDGMCCDYGPGAFRIYVDNELQDSGGQFQFVESKFICVEDQTESPTSDPSRDTNVLPSKLPAKSPSTEPLSRLQSLKPSLSPAGSPSCYDSWDKLKQDIEVSPISTKYVLCPNSILDAAGNTITMATTGHSVMCGEDGDKRNDCVLTGLGPHFDLNANGILFKGLTFSFTKFGVLTSISEASATFVQCEFIVRISLCNYIHAYA